jgi:hypothetical protein
LFFKKPKIFLFAWLPNYFCVTFETLDSLMCIVDFPLGGKQYFLGLTCIFSPIILLRKQFSFAGMSQVSAYRIWHTVVNWLNILMQNTKIVSHLTNDSYVVSKVDCSGKKTDHQSFSRAFNFKYVQKFDDYKSCVQSTDQ